MSKPLALGSLLLLTTAFWTPAALAQSSGPPQPAGTSGATNPPDAGGVNPDSQSATEVSVPGADQPEEQAGNQEIEVSAPGVDVSEEEIIVIGRNIPNLVRSTPQVISVLSADDIARTGEGDIAGALQRVTGLSVTGNGFVYVRGLGDRYSLALLNGLALPSPEPLRRVVPLDIFPTSVLASTLVQKSYSVTYPAEFGGGVINLTTASIPREPFLAFGVSVSGDSETTGQLGYTYYGSDTDWTGFDNGARNVPAPLREAFDRRALIAEGSVFSRRDIQDIAASLLNAPTTLLQRNSNIPANFSADLSGGTSFDIDGGGARLGIIASAGFSNSWRTRDALQQTSGGDDIGTEFRAVRTDNRIVVNGLLGLGLEFDEHKIRWTNLYIRDTLKQGRLAAGYDIQLGDPDPSLPAQQIRQRTAWFERQLINTQLVAEFDFGSVDVDVRGGYANSKREAPYERNFNYLYSPQVNDYVNNLTASAQNATVSFSDLNEDVYNAAADFSYRLPAGITLSAGAAYLLTQRQSNRRDFAYRPANALNLAVAQQRPDFLVSDFNIYTYNILLVETSALAGAAAYEADLEVLGTYLQATWDLADAISLTAGVRYEDAVQSVNQVDLFNQGGLVQPPRLKNDYFLPAATLTWNFAENMQLRLHASKTLARPQFREQAPQIYLDIESDRQFVGNPFLVDSQLLNAEARYEWYFARDQRFSLAGFFKRLDKPIEAIGTFAGGGALQTTFANAPKADLYGVELELQKYFPLQDILPGPFFAARRLVLIGNYTFSESKLKVGEGDETILNDVRGPRPASQVFEDGDALTGQSRHLANLQLGLENTDRLSQQTLLLTYSSERVTNRGPILGETRQPDIVEKPGLRLDFVAREGIELFGADLELKFEARNITGTKFSEYQDFEDMRIVTNEYDVGTSFSLGLGVRF